VALSVAGVAGLVLAAGGSTRLGAPKALLPTDGGTLLAVTVRALLEAGLQRVVVVLGCDAAGVRERAGLPEDARLRVAENERWREGMASSLARGLDECGACQAAVVALGDQPGLDAARVQRLVEAWAAHPGAPLAVPMLPEGRLGHPVLFARELWAELRDQVGDRGGRDVVRRHWSRAARVAEEPLHDLDTAEDVAAWRAGLPPRAGGLDVGAKR
jgi:molybdenum cofactor cytidylyltransferase